MARKNDRGKSRGRGGARQQRAKRPARGHVAAAKKKQPAAAQRGRKPAETRAAAPPAPPKIRFKGRLLENEGLARYTSWRLGGPARFYSLVVPAVTGGPLSLGDVHAGYALLKLVQALVMSLAAVPVYLWARDQSLCDGPAVAGAEFDPSLSIGQIVLPAGAQCVIGDDVLDTGAVDEIERWSRGEPLEHEVRAEDWDRIA